MNIFNEITISIIQNQKQKETNQELRRSVKMVFREETKKKNTTLGILLERFKIKRSFNDSTNSVKEQ